MEPLSLKIKRLESHIKSLMDWLQHWLEEGDYGMAINKSLELAQAIETLEYLKGEA